MVASRSAMSVWKEWSVETKLDLYSHPHAEELSARARMQLCLGMRSCKMSSQQPTVEARNPRALLETRP